MNWRAAVMLTAVLVGAQAARAQEPTVGYQDVQSAFLREEFDAVTSLAQSFILEHPDAPEVPRVWLWLALSLERVQQPHEALRELDRLKDRLVPRDTLWPEVLFWEGDISRKSLQMARAEAAYRKLLESAPGSSWVPQAQMGLGLIDLHERFYESAIEHFRRVSSRDKNSGMGHDALLFEGLCHLQLKRDREAAAIFESLVGRLSEAGVPQAAFYWGESLSGLKRYDEAVKAYQRAIESSTTSQWSQPSQFGLGWAYYQLNRCEDSVKAFDQYLAAASEHRVEALYAQGTCFMRLKRTDEGLQRFERIVSTDLEHPLALEAAFFLADGYRRQERFVAAKDLLHRFLRQSLTPSAQAKIQLRLGSIALEQGNTAQAKTVFTLASEHEDPAIRQAALNGLGDVRLFFGDVSNARTFYEEAMKMSGEQALADYAAYQIGRTDLQLGAFGEAVDVFRRLADQTESALSDDARLALIIAYLHEKKTDKARAVLDAIAKEHAGSELAVRASYYEALLAMEKSDDAGVQRLCRAVVEGAPSTEEAFEARLLLADVEAQATSAREVMSRLKSTYDSEQLSRSQRAKLAKRLGDLAKTERAYPEAVKWYERAGELLPAVSSETAYRIASCYEETGDERQALAWYQKAEQPPWHVRGQLAAAKLLERQDRMADAKIVYERLVNEPIPEAKLIRERLAALNEEQKKSKSR